MGFRARRKIWSLSQLNELNELKGGCFLTMTSFPSFPFSSRLYFEALSSYPFFFLSFFF